MELFRKEMTRNTPRLIAFTYLFGAIYWRLLLSVAAGMIAA